MNKRYVLYLALSIAMTLSSAKEFLNTPAKAAQVDATVKTVTAGDASKLLGTEANQKASCYLYKDFSFWNLVPMQKATGSYTTKSASGMSYEFNFCDYIAKPCRAKTSAVPGVFAKQTSASGTCTDLTDGIALLGRKIESVKATGEGATASPHHVKLTEKSSVVCASDAAQKMAVTFNIKCDPSKSPSDSTSADTKIGSVDDSNKCNPVINLSAPAGCPRFEATAIVKFISKNPIVLALVFIGLGLVLCFRGKAFLDRCLQVIGFLAFFIALMLITSMIGMLNYLDADKQGSIGLTILAVVLSLAAGIFGAWFIMKSKKIAIICLGAFGGYMVGTMFYASLVVLVWTNTWGAIIFGVLGAVIFGLLSFRLFEKVTIILTAFLGSYLWIRGIAMFVGGFPNEMTLYQKLSNGVSLSKIFTPYVYAYLAAIVIFGLVGMSQQWKKDEDDKLQDGFNDVTESGANEVKQE